MALRRRILISPKSIPYKSPPGKLYDSCEFEAITDKALVLGD
jgi:hypothetical protein